MYWASWIIIQCHFIKFYNGAKHLWWSIWKKNKWPFSIVSIRNITLGQTFFEENLRIIIHDIKICQKTLHCDSKMNFAQRPGFSGSFFSGSCSLALKLSFKKSFSLNPHFGWNLGPLHVLLQVSFGCWVTWSISSWQEYYKSVFFLIAKWTSFSVSQQLRPELSAKWIGKIDALVNFIIYKFARLKSKQFSQFFWWEVNLRGLRTFILQKDLLSIWDISHDSTAKRNLSKDM